MLYVFYENVFSDLTEQLYWARELNEIPGGPTHPEVYLNSKLISLLKFVHALRSGYS